MSVKVKLNNRKFLGGNSLLIGSRLFEADEVVTPSVNNTSASNVSTVSNTSTVSNAPTVSNPSTGSVPQQLDVQKISQVINGGFQALVNYVAENIQQIPGPNWPQAPQQLQGSTEEVLKGAQDYLQGVITVAKELIGQPTQTPQKQQPTQ